MPKSMQPEQPKKKVIILIDNLGSGGAQKQVFLLSKYFLQGNLRFKIITYHQYTKDFYSEELAKIGVEVKSFDLPSYYNRVLTIRAAIIKEKPDVLLSFLYGANMLACLIKLSTLQKFSLLVSDRTGLTEVISVKDRLRYQLYRVANRVITNNTDTARKLKERAPWLNKKTITIWNMLEATPISQIDSKPINTQKPLTIVVGASYRRLKNPHNFFKGIARSIYKYNLPRDSIEIMWYGNMMMPNNQAYITELSSILEHHRLTSIVHLHDETKLLHEKIIDADYCALPSFFEGCPNFVMEAMYYGKPVILSEVCSNRDIVEEGLGGFFFDPNDKDSIADAIYQAYTTSWKDRNEMGKHNRQKALNMFSPEEKVKQYFDLINE